MRVQFTGFLNERVEDITEELRKKSGEYALAYARRKELWEAIDPIIMSKRDTHLADCDRLDFQEFFSRDFTVQAIEQQTLYRQGYLDCVTLLKALGVL